MADKQGGRTATRPRLSREGFAAARRRLLQMHYESNVGHLGGNLSALDALLIVFHEYLEGDDSFVLSKGHSAGALYVVLWSIGRLNDDDLRSFHQDATLLPGHPPVAGIPEIAFATGSLGHGFGLAAGSALGLRLRQRSGRVWCMTSDGEWQEGSTWETLIFAAHRRLSNLTVIVDHNRLQGFGTTENVASMSPLWEKVQGFDVDLQIVDGSDLNAIRAALERPADRLKIVILNTVKGRGVSAMENRMESHYLPLTEEQYQAALSELE